MRNRFGGPKSYVHTMAILRSQILEHRSPCILYCSFKKRTHPRKSTHLLLWHNFLYRVKVYMNDHSPCSKLCVANRAHLWSQGWEAKPQALCISEVRSFALNFTEAWLCVGHSITGIHFIGCHFGVQNSLSHTCTKTFGFRYTSMLHQHYC